MGAEQSKTVVIENPLELRLTASVIRRIEKHHTHKIQEEIKHQSPEHHSVEENKSSLLDHNFARAESDLSTSLSTFVNQTQDMENRRRPPDQCQQLKALLTNCYKTNSNNTLACAKEVDDFKLCLQLYCNDQLYHSISK